MLYALGVIIFAVGLLLSIALHEIGHMIPAKKFGVKVTQYMVGFGPTMWSRRRGETEYGVKALPFGGYIRMIGMVPPQAAGSRSRWPRRLATAVEEFRAVSRSEVGPGDAEREFYRLTPGKKMIVMLGGPCMNFVIYLVLSVILLSTLGMPHDDPTLTVSSVYQCVLPVTDVNATATSCPPGAPQTPAYQAGLRPGDTILAINGKHLSGWDEATNLIKSSTGTPLTFTIARAGQDLTLRLTPVRNTVSANSSGTQTVQGGYIGVEAGIHRYFRALGPTQVPGQIVSQVAAGLHAIGNYPSKIHSLWQTVFDGKQRDPNGAVGVVGIGRLGGDVARSTALNVQAKVFTLVGLLASMNLLLFFLNLLPLLPLDGGHVLGALIEAAKRGMARLRAGAHLRAGAAGRAGTGEASGTGGSAPSARPPIFVDTAQMLPIMYAVASVLALLTLLTIYADIVKPINFPGG